MNPNTPSEYMESALRELGVNLATGRMLTSEIPPRLFHYTDAAGLKGILESGNLHATDLRFMNDSGELRYARSVIQEVLDGELTNHDGNLGDRFRKGIAVLNQSDELWGYYAVCFCQDGDLLSQWRAYGNAGGGYAVGFDGATVITRLLKPQQDDRIFEQIDYDPVSQHGRIQGIVKRALSICDKCQTDFAGHSDLSKAVNTCVATTVNWLAREQFRMKHHQFREERECRIVVVRPGITSRFRISRAGLLVPFIELCHRGSEEQRQSVAELRWGPTLTPELAKLSLQTLADALRYEELSIQGSTIPLRG